MKFCKSRLLAITALVCATSAHSHEVALTLFDPPIQVLAADTADENPVGKALRIHLLTMGHSVAPAELKRAVQRLWHDWATPPIFPQVPFQSSSQDSVPLCVPEGYVPAWWLPTEIEVRREAHFDMMALTACEFGLPTRLLDAVIAQESGYNFRAISSAGAMGMMQIMPGTARALGLRNPFDPIANMRAGARYLRQQLDRFGRVDLALAAYNAGPDRRSLRAGYVPAIPETRNYVRTITTNWARLAQLGIETTDSEIRGNAAMTAVHASGYRSVELVRYDGLNAANPM